MPEAEAIAGPDGVSPSERLRKAPELALGAQCPSQSSELLQMRRLLAEWAVLGWSRKRELQTIRLLGGEEAAGTLLSPTTTDSQDIAIS